MKKIFIYISLLFLSMSIYAFDVTLRPDEPSPLYPVDLSQNGYSFDKWTLDNIAKQDDSYYKITFKNSNQEISYNLKVGDEIKLYINKRGQDTWKVTYVNEAYINFDRIKKDHP